MKSLRRYSEGKREAGGRQRERVAIEVVGHTEAASPDLKRVLRELAAEAGPNLASKWTSKMNTGWYPQVGKTGTYSGAEVPREAKSTLTRQGLTGWPPQPTRSEHSTMFQVGSWLPGCCCLQMTASEESDLGDRGNSSAVQFSDLLEYVVK